VERHVFVCVNRRPAGGRPACGTRGGAELAAALREELAARPALWGTVAVTGCECLGPCFEGPNLVIYPEGVWYSGVGPEDAAEIAERHLAGGEPVERLLHVFPDEADDED
jgi:(2Fe-2S) ferredoxin